MQSEKLNSDDSLLRYSRQIMLPQIGMEGQQKLLDAHVLIIGMGGLGSPAALYLATSGVGRLTLVDFDTVDLSNLQRQIAHTTVDIGRPKVESARENLLRFNPEIEIVPVNRQLSEVELSEAVQQANLVLDCSDNFTTRFAINAACVKHQKPLVSGAAIRMEGQVSVFDARQENAPCYQCLYQQSGEELDETCTQNGVLAPLVGVIGSMQALEAIKLIVGMGESLAGKLLLFDAMTAEWRTMRLPKDPACPICGQADPAFSYSLDR